MNQDEPPKQKTEGGRGKSEQRRLQDEQLRTVGRFASQVAHEIRNPLSSISLNMELLEDEVGKAEPARTLIRAVMKELDRMDEIIRRYQQVSRVPNLELRRGRVERVIADLVRGLKIPTNTILDSELGPEIPEVELDEGLLGQALSSVVRNAIEALDGGGRVLISAETVPGYLVIRVRDNGRGMAADVRAQLFEPFFTTKPNGVGLGLATAQQIVQAHRGFIEVDSIPGKGSSFSIYLPL